MNNHFLYLLNSTFKKTKKRFNSIKIRTKIMSALIFISIFCIFNVSLISLNVFKGIMINNSETLIRNLTSQISYNLDERINGFEERSYSILDGNEWLFETGSKNGNLIDSFYFDDQEKRRDFLDLIVQQTALYKYSSNIFLQTENGISYLVQHPNTNQLSIKEINNIVDQAGSLVTKSSPTKWVKINEQVIFVRKYIDNNNFEEKGTIYFFISPSFFNFINLDKKLISNNNLVFVNNEGSVLQKNNINISSPEISKLVHSSNQSFQLQSHRVEYKEKDYLVTDAVSSSNHWRVLGFVSVSELMKDQKLIFYCGIVIAVFGLLIAILITAIISRTIMRNLTIIHGNMIKVERGDFTVRVNPASYDEIGKLGLQFNFMIKQLDELFKNVKKEQVAKQKAEFQTLQAQINPHFLYNTLGSIKWIAHRKQETELESMTNSLIVLLRTSIKIANQFIPFEEEIKYIRHYINLQKKRYGDVFEIKYNIDPDTKKTLILGFLLQPLIENAIYHGIDISNSNGKIEINSFLFEDMIIIQVMDNGKGFSQERLNRVTGEEKEYKGLNSIGLNIINDRLKVFYGDRYDFSIESKLGKGTVVEIKLPNRS